MEIHHTEHDVQHQVTKCMYNHKHMKREADASAGSEAPKDFAATAQKEMTPQNLWQQWQQFMRRGLRFGKGLFRTGEREGTSEQPSVSGEGDTARTAGAEGRSRNTQDALNQAGLLYAQQLTAPLRSFSAKSMVWIKERIRRIAETGKGMHSRFFGRNRADEGPLGQFSQFSRREQKEQLFKQSGQTKKDEADISHGTAFSQDFLLDSYNKSGEYTKLMK